MSAGEPPILSDWSRLGPMLDRLLELPAAAAADELARLAGEDAGLAARLRAALAASDEDGLLAGSAAESWPELWPGPEEETAEPTGELGVGAEVGRWRVTGKLGRGGMGTVYAVERADGVYEQQAALKMIRLGLDEPALRERFLRERQILARLEHPSIARLLDGGVAEDGRPFLVLERVDGEPIDTWCEGRGLDLRERLTLFSSVLEAVGFAHRNLVVHRDLKPSNVLVNERGEPKLLDFGIAKLLVDEIEVERTATRAAVPLTPQYAAPEQITGDAVTTATDVYALGVLLYELVCGERPYRLERGSAAELERQVLETDPVPPSGRARRAGHDPRLVRNLRGDLDAIVLKALAKDPDRRYASAVELGQDLARWLRGQSVEARRASALERARKFASRHRLGVAAGLAVLLSGLVGLAGLGTALVESRSRLAAAQRAQASLDFLVGLFEGADPAHARDRSISAIELLDRGAERLERELAGQAAVRAELARTLGDVYRQLGLYDRARPMLERARRETEDLFGADSAEHAAALDGLAALAYDFDEFAKAEELLRRAIEIRERRLGPRDPATLSSLSSLGDVLNAVGRYQEALDLGERLLAIDREQFGEEHERTLADLASIASTLRRLGRFEEAETRYREVVAASERTLGADHPEVLNRRISLANVLRNRSRREEAEAILLEVVEASERIFGPGHPDTAVALDSLAGLYREEGRFAESLVTMRRALEIQIATIGVDASDTAGYRNNFAILGVVAGDYAAAEEGFREALRIWSGSLEPDHPYRSSASANLGYVLVERGRGREALPLIRESLERRVAHFGPESVEAALSWRILALAQLSLGQLAEARRSAETADRLITAATEDDHPRRADAAIVRAQVELASGDAGAAETLARRALTIRETQLGPAAPQTAEARLVRVRALVALGRLDDARTELERARAELAQAFEPASWRHGEVDLAAAELELAAGDRPAAERRLAAASSRFEAAGLDPEGPVWRRAAELATRLAR